jgi:hypothetical protein
MRQVPLVNHQHKRLRMKLLSQANLDGLSRAADRCLAHDPKLYSHDDLLDILKEVDEGDFDVSDWEANFIESNLASRHFTLKQKKVIQKLDQKYLRRSQA